VTKKQSSRTPVRLQLRFMVRTKTKSIALVVRNVHISAQWTFEQPLVVR
jgi:hypothetical protein